MFLQVKLEFRAVLSLHFIQLLAVSLCFQGIYLQCRLVCVVGENLRELRETFLKISPTVEGCEKEHLRLSVPILSDIYQEK